MVIGFTKMRPTHTTIRLTSMNGGLKSVSRAGVRSNGKTTIQREEIGVWCVSPDEQKHLSDVVAETTDNKKRRRG